MTTTTQKYYATETIKQQRVRQIDGLIIEDAPFTSSSLNSQLNVTKSKSGGGNPRWKDLIANHQEATTPFTGVEQAVVGSGGSWSCFVEEANTPFSGFNQETSVKGKGFLSLGTVQSFVPAGGDALNQALHDARQKAISVVVEHTRAFNSSLFLGEIRETIAMIRKPGKALQDLILGEQFYKTKKRLKQATRRGRRPLGWLERKRSLQKAASELWLENAFGWTPFLSDVKAGFSVLKHYAEGSAITYQTLEARGSATTNVGPVTKETATTATYIRYDVSTRTYQQANVRIYGELFRKAGVTLPQVGLDWGNFVPTVWELLPFSFLVDYFTNIGNVLDSAFVDISSLRRASTVYRHSGVREFKYSNFRITDGAFLVSDVAGSHPDVQLQSRVVSRQVGANLTVLPLRFNFQNSTLHWANMGALIGAAYKGLSFTVAKRL